MLPLKPKTALERKQEKEQEQKKLMTGRFHPGLKLFALDPKKGIIYEVKIETQDTIVYNSKVKKSSRKATINPTHPTLWSLNLKNAKRKFKNRIKFN